MSRVYEARRHRIPTQIPKHSSDVALDLANVESFLSGVMRDIDTILDEWRENPLHGRMTHPVGKPLDDIGNLQPNWIRNTLSMHLKRFFIFVSEI